MPTGYYCGKKQVMIRYTSVGKISTLENERKQFYSCTIIEIMASGYKKQAYSTELYFILLLAPSKAIIIFFQMLLPHFSAFLPPDRGPKDPVGSKYAASSICPFLNFSYKVNREREKVRPIAESLLVSSLAKNTLQRDLEIQHSRVFHGPALSLTFSEPQT